MSNKKRKYTPEEIQAMLEKVEALYVTQKIALFNPNDKKYLLVFNTENHNWELPGGIKEKNEDFLPALTREIQEEVGALAFSDPKLVYTLRDEYQFQEVTYPILVLGYTARYTGGSIDVGDEHTKFEWMASKEILALPSNELHVGMREIVIAAEEYQNQGEYLIDLKRTQADFENYKKRQAESQKELGGYLIEKLVLDIVPVLDNFRAATSHVPPEQKDSPWVTGIQYIEKQLEDVVKSNGVEVIEVKEGDAFDPTIHEAVSSEGTEGPESVDGAEEEAHAVVKVLQKGFKLGGKVIRPAKVTVK